MRPERDTMKQTEFEPALPELKQLLVGLAAEQAEQAELARAARGRRRWRPLAFGGAVVGAAATLLVVLGGGGTSVRTERADAADLSQLAAQAPHLQLAGGWQITNTEFAPGGGQVHFRSEEGRHHQFLADEAEIRWHSASIEERGSELESEGFTLAGPKRMDLIRPYTFVTHESERYSDVKPAQVYVSGKDGEKTFLAAGLWREGGRTFEYRASVASFWELERLMERIELLSREEWFVALQPGGGKWLNDSGGGVIKKAEKVKVGETPDGRPIFQVRALLVEPEEGEKLDFKAPLPTIYREGDKVRMVT